MVSVPITDKVSEAAEVRDVASEGLYVGRQPLITVKERNKMENRLISEPDGSVREPLDNCY